MTPKQPFDEVAGYIIDQIARRSRVWRATNVKPWDDVAQELLIRVWTKYELFDPERAPLQNWVNTVVSNALRNMMRDYVYKSSRPCLGHGKDQHRCVYNEGGNACSWEKNHTGIQCEVCPLYRKWKEKKADLYNITASVSIENHSQEVHNSQGDFIDIEAKKKVIDEKIMIRLSGIPLEQEMYRMLYIEHIDPIQVGTILGYKKQSNSQIPGYQTILKFEKKVYALAKEIIEVEDLI
jgi:hypothetical protein